jgi:CRP/FNR family transcriptional regulator, cyclic AMP receptor protein
MLVSRCEPPAAESRVREPSGRARSTRFVHVRAQDELAAWSTSSREAVAKALHLLRELGWVETHRRRILVRDVAALRDYAG